MLKKAQRKFWIVVDHPQQLVIAIWTSRNCVKQFGVKANLIVSRHAYWRGVSIDQYRDEFAKIRSFERLDYPPPSLSLYLQSAVCILMIPKLFKMAKFVRQLKIGSRDVIIGLSTQQFLENKILSTYLTTKKIGVVAAHTYNNSKKMILWENYRYSLGSFVVKYLEYFFGMKEVVCKYRKRKGPLLDGDTVQRFKKPLAENYDYLLVMKNTPENSPIDSHKGKPNVLFTSYPFSYDLRKIKVRRRKAVVYLGEDFLAADNTNHKTHTALVNRCLDYLRDNYGKSYDLIYKPHPRWNRELGVLNLTGFKIYNDREPAEMFYVKNRINIHAVFSVISTAARSAINAGLSSYLFYKMFPFKKSTLKDWGVLLGDVPNGSYITDFNHKPKKLDLGNWKNNHQIFARDLNFAINRLIDQTK